MNKNVERATRPDPWDTARLAAFPSGFPIAWDPDDFEAVFERVATGLAAIKASPSQMLIFKQMFAFAAMQQCTFDRSDNNQGERKAKLTDVLSRLKILPIRPNDEDLLYAIDNLTTIAPQAVAHRKEFLRRKIEGYRAHIAGLKIQLAELEKNRAG